MNTQAYLRYSLLIPFLVWVLCLVLVLILRAIQTDTITYDDSIYYATALSFAALFYVFGIIVWIIPYLLLAAILFFWSFKARAKTALKVFALSPLAMTVLTVAASNVILLWNSGDAFGFSSAGMSDQGLINLNFMAIGFALTWGYICVGIGYGTYKLLQRRGIIRDEQVMESAPQPL